MSKELCGLRLRQLYETFQIDFYEYFISRQLTTVQREIFVPFYFCPVRPRCNLDEVCCLKLCRLKHNSVWANSKRGETICKCLKLQEVNITLYTVYYLHVKIVRVTINNFFIIRKCTPGNTMFHAMLFTRTYYNCVYIEL